MAISGVAAHSLKTRITVLVTLILVVGLLVAFLFLRQTLRADMQASIGDRQLSTVTMVADQVDKELRDRLNSLRLVAEHAAPEMLAGPQAMQVLLEHEAILPTLFNGGVIVYGMHGDAIAEVPLSAGRGGVNYMDVDVVAAALKEGRTSIGKPILGKVLNAPVFGMAVPIYDAQGQVIGAMAGVVNLGIPSFLDQIAKAQYTNSGDYLLVAPQYRLVVTASDKARILEQLPAAGTNPGIDRYIGGAEGSGVVVNPWGVETLVSGRRIPSAGWFLAMALATDTAFAPIRAMQEGLALVAVLMTAVAGGLILWMLRRQFAPMVGAAQSLRAMSESDAPLQALPVARHDEVGQLVSGFNRLLATVGQREEALRESEFFFRESQRAGAIGSYKLDFSGNTWESSEVLDGIFGIDAAYLRNVQGWLDLVHPDDATMMANYLQKEVLAERKPFNREYRIVRRSDGAVRWLSGMGVATFHADGMPMALVGTIQDITERKLAEIRLQLAARVFTQAREGIVITNAAGVIVEVNDTFSRITGYSHEEALGQKPSLLRSGRQPAEFYDAMWQTITTQGYWVGEVWNRRKDGQIYAEMLTVSTITDADGKALNYVGLFTDITAIKEHQTQLEHMAHFDLLTGLPNRLLLSDRLQQGLLQSQRREKSVAVVYLDLDGFKTINDRYGHSAGDELLIAISQRLKAALREGDTLARIGGDEFVAVLVDLDRPGDCEPLLLRMLRAAGDPVILAIAGGEVAVSVSASLGVTLFPSDGSDADLLIRHADQAMYAAKQAGKNRYHLFDIAHDSVIQAQRESLERIGEALLNQEFVLYYQPKANIRSGDVVGAEALIRWQHPQRGLLSPAAFLPVMENHPLSIQVGEWVLDTVMAQMGEFRAQGLELHISANVGALQLQQSGFAERLGNLLAAHADVPSHWLQLEVLETSALDDLNGVASVMRACQALGVDFALDDFGTGYSSLSYLKHLPVAMLKIDQSFVHDMLDDPNDLAIVNGVVGLARAFGRQVIAEGVETRAHGDLLVSIGCDLAQGYGIAKPMLAKDLPGWIAKWQAGAGWAQPAQPTLPVA